MGNVQGTESNPESVTSVIESELNQQIEAAQQNNVAQVQSDSEPKPESAQVQVQSEPVQVQSELVQVQPEVTNEPSKVTDEQTETGSMFGNMLSAVYNMASYMTGSSPVESTVESTAEQSAEQSTEQSAERTDEPAVEADTSIIGYTDEGKEMRRMPDGTIDVDMSVSGKKFAEMFENCKVIKLTNESCCHNGFQYVEGLNMDTNVFDSTRVCGPDGLYFCTESNAQRWFDYVSNITYVWDVEIPEDARVCVYEDKLKADKFILSNKRTLAQFISERVRKMVHTERPSEEVFEYISNLDEFICDEYDVLNDPMIDLLNIDPAVYYTMPEYLITNLVFDEALRLGLCNIE